MQTGIPAPDGEKSLANLARRGAILLLPLFLLIASYVILDPFGVIRPGAIFRPDPHIPVNRDFVSTETFLARGASQRYGGFVLGNSRTLAYRCSDLAPYWPSVGCFHFDASSESLWGIERKLAFLRNSGVPLREALVILDADTLNNVGRSSGHLFIKHPATSGESVVSVQAEFLKAFIHPSFLLAYLRYRFTGVVPRTGSRALLDETGLRNAPAIVDESTNDLALAGLEAELEANPEAYRASRLRTFIARTGQEAVAAPMIRAPQLDLLRRMKESLRGSGARAEIIVGPSYDQVRINPADIAVLREVFGPACVHDYSGVNAITSDVSNWYEWSHYRPRVGRSILQDVYGRPSTCQRDGQEARSGPGGPSPGFVK